MTAAQAADALERRLAAGLAARATNHDFEQIGVYLRSINRPDLADACLQRYLAVYRRYENENNRTRGDVAFYLVLKCVLDLSKPAQLDVWYDALTSMQKPYSPVRERFEALGKPHRDQLLQQAKAPREARKETASVFGELRDAFRSARGQLPKNDEELLGFNDPVPQAEALWREYNTRLAELQRAYDVAAGGKDAKSGKDLGDQIDAFWSFVQEQRRDGLRLFQLLAYWRLQRFDVGGIHVPSSVPAEIAYVQIVAALLSYALHTKAYATNVRLKSFTNDEWKFVLKPLHGRRYESTYDNQLHAFPSNAASFPKQCELFLHLLAFARKESISLATNEEMARVAAASVARARTVIGKLKDGSIGRYRAPAFVVTQKQGGTLVAAGTYSVGTEIAETFRIVHFEGSPRQIYVEFDGIPCAIFNMSFDVFIRFARDAPYELVRKYTAPLLVLIPLLFEILMAIPGIVDGGFIGLVRALLSPVEMAAASSALEEFGLDPDKAGWWLLAVSLLTHRVTRGADERPNIRALKENALDERGTQATHTELAASRRAAIDDKGLDAAERRGSSAVSSRAEPTIPWSKRPANDNALIRGIAAPANDNRLTEPTLAELEQYAATAEQAQQVAVEIAQLENQIAQEESQQLEGAAVASAGGGRRRAAVASGGTAIASRGVAARGTGGPVGGAAPRAGRQAAGRTVVDRAKAANKGIDATTIKWVEDVAAEWRKQTARFKKVPGLSAQERGRRAHAATQRAIEKLHPGTIAEQPTGVQSSRTPRVSDLEEERPTAAVAELKPWAWPMPGGRLATSREAIESGVETLQIQAYGILDRDIGRPVFVFTGDGKVYTPKPSGWDLIGKPGD